MAALRTLFELQQTQSDSFWKALRIRRLSAPTRGSTRSGAWSAPGNKDIQYALHADYGSNVERYDEWHRYFREHQPPTLVVWGKNDFVFAEAGAKAYCQDLKTIEVHLLAAGHFALETKAPEIAELYPGVSEDAHAQSSPEHGMITKGDKYE